MKLILISLTFVTLILGSLTVARADTVTLMLTNPNQTGTPGSTLLYTGFITNAGTLTVSISGVSLVLVDGSSGRIGEPGVSPDYMSMLPITLLPGQSTGVIPLVTFTLDSFYTGPYPATMIYTLGLPVGDPGNPTSFAVQNFSATIEPVPEPATLILLGTGLAGMVGAVRRGRDSARRGR